MKRIKLEKVTVKQMTSNASGREIANQFIIYTPTGVYFQSYSTIIACRIKGVTYLDKARWDCSVTTGKYRNQFTGDVGIAETRRHIAEGTYKLANLN